MPVFDARVGYGSGMEIPLTLAILALIAVIGALIWTIHRLLARSEAAHAEMMRVSREYSEQALKIAADTARNQPKYAEKMLDSLTRSISEVTKGSADAMTALYGPIRHEEQQATAEMGDIITPWYGAEGSMDPSDPTDAYLVADPTEYPEGGNNLIMDGDDEPFGIPGLKVNG